MKTNKLFLISCLAVAALSHAAWNGSASQPKSDTTILGEKYYKISTPEELAWVKNQYLNNSPTINVLLMKDIVFGNDINAVCKKVWQDGIAPNEEHPYYGKFNGNGHTIYGLNIEMNDSRNSSSTTSALFGYIGTSAVVKNLTISKANIEGSSAVRVGAVAGVNFGLIDSVRVTSDVEVKGGTFTGGIVGNNGRYGTTTNTTSAAKVSSGTLVGGITGANTGIIGDCVNNGEVTGSVAAGGIVGFNTYYPDYQHVPGRVYSSENNGLVQVLSKGTAGVEDKDYVMEYYAGGVVGYNDDGVINNTRNNGNVTASTNNLRCLEYSLWICFEEANAYAGGVVGMNSYSDFKNGDYSATVLNSFSTAKTVSGSVVGGVVGSIDIIPTGRIPSTKALVENCYYDSDNLKSAKAVGENGGSVETVKGMKTKDMKTLDFTEILNTRNHKESSSFAWFFETGKYPMLVHPFMNGAFKVVFMVGEKIYLDATTEAGKLHEKVSDPVEQGKVFNSWIDVKTNEYYTSAKAMDRVYSGHVTYEASFSMRQHTITFVASYGPILGKKDFEDGKLVFYDEDNIPENATLDDGSLMLFTNWDKEFQPASEPATYTANYTKNYIVRFFVKNVEVKADTVIAGKAANAPVVNVASDEIFRGWDKAFNEVNENMVVNADIVKRVHFCYSLLGDNICDDYPIDTTLELPQNSKGKDSTCTAWMNGFEDYPYPTVEMADAPEALHAVCHPDSLKVNFFAFDRLLKTQRVGYGEAAEAPEEEPKVDHMRFVKWDKDFSEVFKDLDVNAEFEALVSVCYVQFGVQECFEAPKDSLINMPTPPANEDSSCIAWVSGSVDYTNLQFIAKDAPTDLHAVCHPNFVDVLFYAFEDRVDSQQVAYGGDAVKPADPDIEGFQFIGWDKEFTHVTQNPLKVFANFKGLVNFCYWALGREHCQVVPEDQIIVTPALPEDDADSTCTSWNDDDVEFTAASFVAKEAPKHLYAVCRANYFDVKFYSFETLLDSQRVAYDADAVAPKNPSMEGFSFIGWDTDFTHVKKNLVVKAKYEEAVKVCYIMLGEKICRWIARDSSIAVPNLPKNEDSTCIAWYHYNETLDKYQTYEPARIFGTNPPEDLHTRCHANYFDVLFLVADTLLDSVRVAYGENAAPVKEIPTMKNKRFVGWDMPVENVTKNFSTNALYIDVVNVCITMLGEKDCHEAPLDSVFTLPALAVNVDSTCTAWKMNGQEFAKTGFVAADYKGEVVAQCHANYFDVRFYAKSDLVDSQRVTYGESAISPANPFIEGMVFRGWDKNFMEVTSNLVVNGIFVKVDTIFVKALDSVVDTVVVAEGDTVKYVLPNLKDTENESFDGWTVGDRNHDGHDMVRLTESVEIVASFKKKKESKKDAIQPVRVSTTFSVKALGNSIQVIGANVGESLAILDLQGRVILRKSVDRSVELVTVPTAGSYLVRVGRETKRVVIR